MDKKALTESARLVETLPLNCLPPSSLVDALHLAAGTKEVFRSRLLDEADTGVFADWCKANGMAGIVDEDTFVVVGKNLDVVEHALLIDRSPVPHEMPFGLLLGYPTCCCRVVAEAGEAEIDRLVDEASTWEFSGVFSMIDPSGYADGEALICHVPCSPRCLPSLRLAQIAMSFLHAHPHLLLFRNWRRLGQSA